MIALNCRNCPYGEEDFKRRMYWYEKTVKEQGIPNDIYHYLSPEDAPDEFEQFLWCDKVGGKVYWAGRCSDAYMQSEISQNRSKQKRRNKRERDQKHRDHFENLWNVKKHKWFPPVLYIDYIYINHEIFDREAPYYKKLTPNHGGRYQRYCKRQANKHVRRYTGEISGGGNYKKVYEYKWSIH